MGTSNKYEPGEFGYWWTVTMGKKDIEGVDCKRGIDASCEGLTSLRGAPRSIDGNFYCSDNRLTSLEHCPKRVAGSFYCKENRLTSLEHCPTNVGGGFYCHRNNLKSLEYCPERVSGNFYCDSNEITNLTHAPREVGKYFGCENNPIADPVTEIISNNIMAEVYRINEGEQLTFKNIAAEKQRRANIKRQLGPFAIAAPGKKL